ncbi:hypothetical protein COB52_04910 [Candidatus Kaiserbacteria bacterium]|nr:MAG: hypothetical protein COB52_04910 [Candidatus Kaiserbacteria bacterium]
MKLPYIKHSSPDGEYDPLRYLQRDVEALIKVIDARPVELPKSCFDQSVDVQADKNSLLKFFYERNVIEVSEVGFYMGNKLIYSEILKHYLKEDYARFHQKTLGLKSFLLSNEVVARETGKIIKSEEEISKCLDQVFPHGFVAKPAFDLASITTGAIVFSKEDFLQRLLHTEKLFAANEILGPSIVSHAVVGENSVTGGEKYILQEKFAWSTAAGEKNNEFRVHALYNKLVPDATWSRWRERKYNRPDLVKKVNQFVQELLDLLPLELTLHNVWAFDVMVDADEELSLMEANTNYGNRGPWSGFLRVPSVMGAYVRFLENDYGFSFKGFNGELLREDLSGVRKYIKLMIKENYDDLKAGDSLDHVAECFESLGELAEKFLLKSPSDIAEYQSSISCCTEYLNHYSRSKTKAVEEMIELMYAWMSSR